MTDTDDIKFMKIALKMSLKGTGFTEPNPLVGAVVVKDGRLIASGYHKRFGAAHAERMALAKVKEKDTTLYVTLEPCSHYGKTPPCTDYIIKKGVRRVVVALRDPNPLVNGKGIKELSGHGITVDTGICEAAASRINRHYMKFSRERLPYITLKAGVSIDGKLTDNFRHSQWITSQQLRNISNSLRGEFSAVLVGAHTVLEDNPRLTIRDKAWKNKKLYRVILDTHNTLPTGLQIFQEQDRFPLIIFSSRDAQNKEEKSAHHYFLEITGDSSSEPGLPLPGVLKQLATLGISSVLVEGGGRVIESFLKQGLYDEILFFTAPKLIGGKDSVELFAGGAALPEAPLLKHKEIIELPEGYIIRGFKD